MMKIVTVIGQGYVGLNLAITASKHYKIFGFDVDGAKIASLRSGASHIEDVSNQSLQNAIKSGSYTPTSNEADLKDSDIFIICVPTPLDNSRNPDMSFINSACEIINRVATKNSLIINESTSYPGTLRDFIKPKVENGKEISFHFAVAPERVDPGRTDFTGTNTPRILSGIDTDSTEVALEFYNKFNTTMQVVDTPEIAETAKLFENTFRQVNIALVNELALICGKLDIDVYKVLSAAATKPYGFMKFKPGAGVGGHCIPVDPTYLAFAAENKGASAEFIRLANKVNSEMPKRIVEKCAELINGLSNKEILIVGVSYKPGIADTRETPAKEILNYCNELGARVSWWDPIVDNWLPGKIEEFSDKKFELVIVQVLHNKDYIKKLSELNTTIFDCTGDIENANRL